MKTIILFAIIVFSMHAVASAPLDKYTGTTWERSDLDSGFEIQVEFLSADNGTDTKAILSINNGEFVLTAVNMDYNEAFDEDGIHGGQDFIALYEQLDGEATIGLFIGGENCLLLPDTEAPEDCLTLKTSSSNSH